MIDARPPPPDTPEALLGQATALLNGKRPREALRAVTAALARFADDPRLCNLAGECAVALGEPARAEAFFRRDLAGAPQSARVHFNLGLLYAQGNRTAEAERHYRCAMAIAPDNVAAYGHLGLLLNAAGRCEDAEQCYRRALAIHPGNAALHANLAMALAKQQHVEEAERHYRRATELDPDRAHFTQLANLLARQRRYRDAEQVFAQAIAHAPNDTLAHFNFAVLLEDLDRDEEAEAHYRRALALDAGLLIARHNLAYLLLRNGRYEEAWPLHEIRHSPDLPPEQRLRLPAPFSFPQWQGEPLPGKSLLLWPEQGLGDEIQFCRYLPLLKQRGAKRLTVICKTPLKALLERMEGVDAVIALDEFSGAVAAHDYWCYPLSLPFHFNTTLTDIPDRLPYLHAPPDRAARWSPRLPREGMRVGLAWKGNAEHKNDAERSLALSALAPLWSVPGVHFISLQKARDEEQALHPPPGQPLVALGHAFGDLADTAAVIEQLDLVISVDTVVAHLSGALAKPCWLLLPHYHCDWRWLRGRGDSPWYPGVMRLFRQPRGGGWAPVIEQLTEALRERAAAYGR
jgi:Flp pilus assembly protein TadD